MGRFEMLESSLKRQDIIDLLPISKLTTDFLYEPTATARMIRDLRWKNGKFCPRCKSTGVKKINSFCVQELLQCGECGYNFNSTSGTIFQGSKLPLNRHLQLFIAFDFFGKNLALREIAAAVGVSQRTAKLQLERIGPADLQNDYLYGPQPASIVIGSHASMQDLLDRHNFSIDMTTFLGRMSTWLRM
jgi:transposase-like protein